LTHRMVEKIFATDFEDWPAVLRAMHETGEEFRRGENAGVQIQPAEIRAYFDKEVLPKLKGANAEEEFAKRRQEIEEKLLGDRVNQALNDWLKETRSRTKIEFRKEAFE